MAKWTAAQLGIELTDQDVVEEIWRVTREQPVRLMMRQGKILEVKLSEATDAELSVAMVALQLKWPNAFAP